MIALERKCVVLRRLCARVRPAKTLPTLALLFCGCFLAATGSSYAQISLPGSGIIATVAGGNYGSLGDGGLATSATLSSPQGVAVDSSGNIYIADAGHSRIREVLASTGDISTVAGDGVAWYTGNGGPATSAEIIGTIGIAVDSSGNIYLTDAYNFVIREVVASTGYIYTIAGLGSGCPGQVNSVGDGCAATQAYLDSPTGVAVDSAGNLYIADSSDLRIRMVSASTGIITTVAGTGSSGYSGDGGAATSATFAGPFGVALDSSGNIYISDVNDNCVRKVTASTGVITTVAGTGTSGFSGDGAAATSAELRSPMSVAVDSSGNIFIADSNNVRIREVSASTGYISTVAGDGANSYTGDGGAATSAAISPAYAVAVDSNANVYIADTPNQAIRVIGH